LSGFGFSILSKKLRRDPLHVLSAHSTQITLVGYPPWSGIFQIADISQPFFDRLQVIIKMNFIFAI
jgi:hypothetical protein